MLLPPIAQRREIDSKLSDYFQSYRPATFKRAISDFCRFYHVKRPRIEWYEYIDWGHTAGRTFDDGRIYLVHPENWKRGRIYKSERMWVQTVYHELAHYVFWADAERKAEAFTHRMVRGLKRPQRRAGTVVGLRRPLSSRSARPAARKRMNGGVGRRVSRAAASRQRMNSVRTRRRRPAPVYRSRQAETRRISRR